MKHIKKFESYYTSRTLTEDEKVTNAIVREHNTQNDDEYASINGEDLKKSLEMIGDGEIIEKGSYGEKFMYKEMLHDNQFIFIVHGDISKPIMTKGYTYQVTLWENDPRDVQIGGGYGASGIVSKNHTNLFNEVLGGEQQIFTDINLISNVCKDLMPYLEEKMK
jgi:hypothetical protein